MTNRVPRLDTDGDDQVENAQVDALVNLAASDALSAYPLANTDLANSSVTVAGNSVSLGGSTGVAHDDLSDDVTGATDQDNSGTTAIQDVTVDAHGHVTSMTAADVGGGSSWTTTTVTADTTLSDNDEALVDSSGGTVTVTLPTPSNGVRVRVLRTTSANSVTIGRSGTENINRTASDLSLNDLESVELVSDGTDWWIV